MRIHLLLPLAVVVPRSTALLLPIVTCTPGAKVLGDVPHPNRK